MKNLIKVNIFFFCFIVVFIMSILSLANNSACAEDVTENAQNVIDVEEKINGLLNKRVKKLKVLYSLDESKNFLFANFVEGGYAVFFKDTLEMLEYSPQGDISFEDVDNYYCGPGQYLYKTNSGFRNKFTGEEYSFSNKEKLEISKKIKSLFSDHSMSYSYELEKETLKKNSTPRNSAPSFDEDNPITIEDFYNGNFIANYDYFLNDPQHGINNSNSCGSVATQLLLTYNNYYNDRKIIPNEFLCGYDNNILVDPERDPNLCADPMKMNRFTLGSNNEYYNYVRDEVELYFLVFHIGSSVESVYNAISTILSDRNNVLVDDINYSLNQYKSPNDDNYVITNRITEEINDNRPVIINLAGGLDHFAVAYGCCEYSYSPGMTYSGFVTHFGWSEGDAIGINYWVNSAWCIGCITLQINHTHNYLGNIDETEMNCSCGHRLYYYPTIDFGNEKIVTGFQHGLSPNAFSGFLAIPTLIDNKYVTSIDSDAFYNSWNINKVNLPPTVKYINSGAFRDCQYLETINLTSSLNLINFPNQTISFTNYYYTEHCLNVNLEPDTVYTLSFNYTSLTSTGDLTDVFTSLGVGENSFTTDLPFVKYFSGTSGELAMSFIPTFTQLSTSKKLWCRFIRTSTPQTVSVRIKNVVLEKGVTDIAIDAFRGCDYLCSPGLQYTNITSSTYSVSQGLFHSNVLFIPTYINSSIFNELKAISPSGFANNNNIKWVFMQEGLTTIGDRAFQFCSNLLKIDMMLTSLETIDEYTFDVCAVNSDPNHVHNPHSLLYGHCMIEEITLPSTLRYIEEGAFIRTGLPTACQLPNSVETIGDYAFYSSIRLAIKLPNSLTSIGDYAFAECESLMVTNVDTGVLSIGSHAFYNTELPTLTHLSASVQTIGASAFEYSEFSSDFALVANNNLTTVGESAFAHTNLKRIVLSTSVTTVGSNAFNSCTSLTIYTGHSVGPTGWANTWNSSNRPVFWGCSISGDKTYVISFVKSASNPTNTGATNGISDPYRDGYNFGGWYTTSDFSGTQYTSTNITSAPNGTLYAKWTKKSCVAEGTLITLADGTQIAVENLTGNESLLVWNMLTGQYDSAPILFIDSDSSASYEVIKLTFSDNTEVKVIDEHAFFDMTLGEYVFLRRDASQYIGHYFNKKSGNTWTTVQLTNVTVMTETTTAWSPVTYGHLCYYVNGMLSMPGATEGLINIFDVDTTLMKYDAVQMAADIQTYGLYTYAEFNAIIPLPEYVFNAFNGQYLKVSIGKGLITLEGIVILLERYAIFFS